MKWNWQQPEWPNFYWDQERLAQSEQTFLQETGAVSGAVMHLSGLDRSTFTVELMTGDAVDTAQLEGEVLDRGSVQSSIQRQLGLHRDRRLIPPAEAGIAEMMVSNFQPFQKPLTGKSLGAWHRRILQGRVDVETLGCYRRHAEPMQIVSGLGRKRRVHFEAPPTARIGKEMALFLKWFNRTAPTEAVGSPLPVLVRAGIAHLWFESIHPFEDGNGRIGRAIAEKALMQGLLRPTVTALSTTLLRKRKAYYHALEQASNGLDSTGWLEWFSAACIESMQYSLRQVRFLLDKTRLMDMVRDRMNPRQEKALLRLFAAGPEGFEGGLSARNYAAITGAASATATRDLAGLVEMGALVRTGTRKAARYRLAFLQ